MDNELLRHKNTFLRDYTCVRFMYGYGAVEISLGVAHVCLVVDVIRVGFIIWE